MERTVLEAVISTLRSVNPNVGHYQIHVVDPNTFEGSIKLSNGRIKITLTQYQDAESHSLNQPQIDEILKTFVSDTDNNNVLSKPNDDPTYELVSDQSIHSENKYLEFLRRVPHFRILIDFSKRLTNQNINSNSSAKGFEYLLILMGRNSIRFVILNLLLSIILPVLIVATITSIVSIISWLMIYKDKFFSKKMKIILSIIVFASAGIGIERENTVKSNEKLISEYRERKANQIQNMILSGQTSALYTGSNEYWSNPREYISIYMFNDGKYQMTQEISANDMNLSMRYIGKWYVVPDVKDTTTNLHMILLDVESVTNPDPNSDVKYKEWKYGEFLRMSFNEEYNQLFWRGLGGKKEPFKLKLKSNE